MLDDPNFDRSVIYMVEHHDEGALGLVLNRPSGESLNDPLDGWVSAQFEPAQVFSGGPVEPDALIALARAGARSRRVDGRRRRLLPRSAVRRHRIGRSGGRSGARRRKHHGPSRVPWLLRMGIGQLEAEIESGSWLVVDTRPATCSPPSPANCGGACCAASPVASAGWPRRPTTCPRTDAVQRPPRRRPLVLAPASERHGGGRRLRRD